MLPLSLKLIAGLCALGLLAGCGDSPRSRSGLDPKSLPARGAQASIDTAEQLRSWAPGNQLAFFAGKVLAAERLFMVGDTKSAGRLLDGLGRQAASADRGGFQELGFEPRRLDALSDALILGLPDGDVALQFESTRDHLMVALAASGALTTDTVSFLMLRSAEAYEQGVRFGEIVDLDAYQTAYGTALAARDIVQALEAPEHETLDLELRILVMMWPTAGPVEGRTPPPEFRMAEQFGRVRLALAGEPSGTPSSPHQ